MSILKGLVDLTNSERGLYGVAVLVCATVLTLMGILSSTEWAAVAVGSQGIHAWAKTTRPGGADQASTGAAPDPSDDPKNSKKEVP